MTEVQLQNDIVRNWFEDEFFDLHPLLQKLHLYGGELSGEVEISYGSGLAGLIGKRLAGKMKLPGQGVHQLVVSISHSQAGLHWNRRFNDSAIVKSVFVPVGNHENGYWVETTGPVTMMLTVDIIKGGWYWRCLKVALFGIPIPVWLMPESRAFKFIEDGQYVFQVSFSYPLLGNLVSYQGILDADSARQ